MRIPCKLMLALVASFLSATALPAQDTTELLNRMKAMEDRIRALETEVQTLKGQQAGAVAPQPQPASVVAPVLAQAPPEPVSIGGAGGAAAKVLNPDNGRRMAKALADKFSSIQPANAAQFAQRVSK